MKVVSLLIFVFLGSVFASENIYVVKKGDIFGMIVQNAPREENVSYAEAYRNIVELNKHQISNFEAIEVGLKIILPKIRNQKVTKRAVENYIKYKIKEKDTLSEIAYSFFPEIPVYPSNGGIDQILAINFNIKNPDLVEAGELISIPDNKTIAQAKKYFLDIKRKRLPANVRQENRP